MANRFVLNETSYHGKGAISSIADEFNARGFSKALVCCDPDLIKFGVADKVFNVLKGADSSTLPLRLPKPPSTSSVRTTFIICPSSLLMLVSSA